MPQLRIVDAEVFAAVQTRLDERGHDTPAAARRPRHLLSGLLRCGCCGRALVLKDRDSKGRRIYCTRMREGGGCTNTRAFYLDEIERRVLAGLEAQLRDPRAIERFLHTYTEERKRLAAAGETKRHRKETRLGEVSANSTGCSIATSREWPPKRKPAPASLRYGGAKSPGRRALRHTAPDKYRNAAPRCRDALPRSG